MRFEPADDNLLMEPIELNEVSTGGIYLPDTVDKGTRRGRVLATGPGYRLATGGHAPLPWSVGDTLLYYPHGGEKLTLEGNEYLIIPARNIWGRFVEEKDA